METKLDKVPLIPLPQLGKLHAVGVDAVEGAARRVGVEPARGPDNIRRFSFAQAQAVDAELRKATRR